MINLENQEAIYKTLLKVNQIGKKLSNTSEYILSNGIILGYSKQEMSDTEANPVSVGFIDKSLHKKLDGLGDHIGLLINGDDLYEHSKNDEFDSIEISKDSIIINFVHYSVNESSYEENFKDLLRSKGYSDEDIEISYMSNYMNNIDIYDLFLKYKKDYVPVKEKSIIGFKCYFAYTNNYMYKKSENIISELTNSKLLYTENINRDILDIMLTSKQPVIRKCELMNGNNIKVRLMKSLFMPISSKNDAYIHIFESSKRYLLITQIELTGVTLFNIFQIVDY